ncbi:MAG TPA: hypothetical protein DCL41_00430 [Bdellovibrionales bacterium]|nr:hypothetical protein [Pseudobdellovibrionaceae bacterium]HAG90302.1 hypothetical protein [Bdellovibrionales bacterium]|tara:strand:- start:198 stop:644 length:447 start_codon:yes stop_codon:yes gene_type:complete
MKKAILAFVLLNSISAFAINTKSCPGRITVQVNMPDSVVKETGYRNPRTAALEFDSDKNSECTYKSIDWTGERARIAGSFKKGAKTPANIQIQFHRYFVYTRIVKIENYQIELSKDAKAYETQTTWLWDDNVEDRESVGDAQILLISN